MIKWWLGVWLLALGPGCSVSSTAELVDLASAQTDDAAVTPADGGSGSSNGFTFNFRGTSAAIRCSQTAAELRSAGAAEVTIGGTSLFAGYVQATATNQNPLLVRFDGGAQTYCVEHETQAPDGRAYGLSYNGSDKLYVVYTVDGGGSALDTAGQGGWLSSYGNGGGPLVSFIGSVNPSTGQLMRGTFISALLGSGKINTLKPTSAPVVLADGRIEFHGTSAFSPRNPDKSAMTGCMYPLDDYRAIFLADFTQMSCASIKNCNVQVPCPNSALAIR